MVVVLSRSWDSHVVAISIVLQKTYEIQPKVDKMTDPIRKAINRVTERLKDYADAVNDFAGSKRLVGQRVPVRVNHSYPVSKKNPTSH